MKPGEVDLGLSRRAGRGNPYPIVDGNRALIRTFLRRLQGDFISCLQT